MQQNKYVTSQLLDFVPDREFRRLVAKYRGNYKVSKFGCWSQFVCLFFGQLTFRESLSQIIICLRSRQRDMYRLGIRHQISRSTLFDANENRDWKIYRDLAMSLIGRARILYKDEPTGLNLGNTVYAFDSTTIDLCLKLFSWAKFKRTKGAVKLHTMIDLRGPIPNFIEITTGKVADVKVLDNLELEPESFYTMDRAYVDFERLYRFTLEGAYFVTRAKRNLKFNCRNSRKIDPETGLRCDQDIVLSVKESYENYPQLIRRVVFRDPDTKKRLVFLTNNFELAAEMIPKIYKQRWQVELFFKWIKQHLRIKKFYGTSQNALKTQIWIAVCVYVVVAIVKRELGISYSLSKILDILSVNPFSQVPLRELLMESDGADLNCINHNQLEFNNL